VLGLLFVALTLLVNVAYAVAAGSVADLFRRRSSGRMGAVARAGGYFPGVVYIVLGVTAALAGPPSRH
ncbi:MAG: LysE family translocator, partial [Thermoanaerobaculia bacterium]